MDIKAIIHAALFTPMRDARWGLTLLFWDKPGTGKSSIVRQEAAHCGLPCEVLSPGMRGEGAFGVVPVPDMKRGILTYPPPEWVGKMGERGVVFLDEVNTAPPAIQPPLLGLALDGVIGAVTLPGGVRRVAAANPVEDAAGGWDLPPALANRFGHISWQAPSLDDWSAWLLGDGSEQDAPLDAAAEEKRILAAWPTAWARARGSIAGFLRRRPELLHKQPNAGDPQLSRAWPSRRSWEFATRAYASAEVHGLSETDADEIVAAFVGTAAAAELAQYLTEADLPDPEELLDGQVKWKHDARRLDKTLAVLGACAALVAPAEAPKRKERVAEMWRIMLPVIENAPDVAVPAGRILCRARLGTCKEAIPVLAKLQPVLAAAGVRAAD